jgi:hypothetical protein
MNWTVFWLLNELLWPVYAGLVGVYVVSVVVINLSDWLHGQTSQQETIQPVN